MKVCFRCKDEKDESDFYRRTRNRDTLYSWCKKCFVEYTNERAVQKKKRAVEFMGGKCVDCGRAMDENDNPYYLFDFHHLDPSQKDVGFKDMRFWSWKRIVKELAKCVLVCCVCHRHREYKKYGSVAESGLLRHFAKVLTP
jgi:hypothetical protein